MYDRVVTVFNYYTSPTGTFWYPHVLSGVHLETDRGQIIRKYGSDSKDNAQLHVKCTERDGNYFINIEDKEVLWLSPKDWKKQVNDKLENTITFSSDMDFFMWGKWDGESVINDMDYADRRYEGFYAYMNTEKDFVFKITSAGGPYGLIPHFEILGA